MNKSDNMDLRDIKERLDRLENKSKENFFEIEKKFAKLEPIANLEERIQELEDLLILQEVEIAKIREKLGMEIEMPELELEKPKRETKREIREIEEFKELKSEIENLKDKFEEMRKTKIGSDVIERLNDLEFAIKDIEKRFEKLDIRDIERTTKMVDELRDELSKIRMEKLEKKKAEGRYEGRPSNRLISLESRLNDLEFIVRDIEKKIEKPDLRYVEMINEIDEIKNELHEMRNKIETEKVEKLERPIAYDKIISLETKLRGFNAKLIDIEERLYQMVKEELESIDKMIDTTKKNFDLKVISLEEKIEKMISRETKKDLISEIENYRSEFENLKRRLENEINRITKIEKAERPAPEKIEKKELEKDIELKATKILTKYLNEFAEDLDKKIPIADLVTKDEFKRSLAMIGGARAADIDHILRRIESLEGKMNDIVIAVKNMSSRMPVIVE